MFGTRFDELVNVSNKVDFNPYGRKWYCVVLKDPIFDGKKFREYLQGSSQHDMMARYGIVKDTNPNLVSITEVSEIPLLYRPIYILSNGTRYILSLINTDFGYEMMDSLLIRKNEDLIPPTIRFKFNDIGELCIKVEVNPLGIDLIVQP